MLDCDNPFWKFSLAVYAAPGVAAECLALQSALNIDVNFLLFGAWLGATKKIILDETNLAAVSVRVRHWQETVVQPLRTLRKQIKTMPELSRDPVKALRQDIADAELRAEQIEQAFLFEAASDFVGGTVAAQHDEAIRRNVNALLQRKTLPASAGLSAAPPAELLIAAAIAYRSKRL